MTRANLFLVFVGSALVGSGCHSNVPGDITFYWNFQNSQGVVAGDYSPGNTGCDVAGVDTIEIDIDNGTSTWPCVGIAPSGAAGGVPGITLTGFAPGDYPFTATGLRSNEVVFTVTGTATAQLNTNTPVDLTLLPVSPQSLVVYYNINGLTPTQCTFPGLVYTLTDAAGNVVATTETASGQNPVPCDPATFGFAIPALPLGMYRFQYLATINSVGNALDQICSWPAPHTGFPDIVNLTTATGTCP